MNTEDLRRLTEEAATRLGGKLWPNRLGFDCRRWEYCWSEAYGSWQALYRRQGYGVGTFAKVGRGETPEQARAAATPQREED